MKRIMFVCHGNICRTPARDELKKHGIACDGKRAAQLQESDYAQYDLFLCMDRRNLQNALAIFGGDPEKRCGCCSTIAR